MPKDKKKNNESVPNYKKRFRIAVIFSVALLAIIALFSISLYVENRGYESMLTIYTKISYNQDNGDRWVSFPYVGTWVSQEEGLRTKEIEVLANGNLRNVMDGGYEQEDSNGNKTYKEHIYYINGVWETDSYELFNAFYVSQNDGVINTYFEYNKDKDELVARDLPNEEKGKPYIFNRKQSDQTMIKE